MRIGWQLASVEIDLSWRVVVFEQHDDEARRLNELEGRDLRRKRHASRKTVRGGDVFAERLEALLEQGRGFRPHWLLLALEVREDIQPVLHARDGRIQRRCTDRVRRENALDLLGRRWLDLPNA